MSERRTLGHATIRSAARARRFIPGGVRRGPAATSKRAGGTPYRGLSAYEADDAEWFFGRERLLDELVEKVENRRFVAVFGPSGTGKSSLLRAGLIPKSTAGGTNRVLLVTSGADPIRECAIHLSVPLGTTAGAVKAELDADPTNLDLLLRQSLVGAAANAEILVVVDQFEELFTQCGDRAARTRFLSALTGATEAPGSRCRVVLGVRADFYSHCLLEPGLAGMTTDAQVAMRSMTAEELRRVIVHPARHARCVIENALLTTLVAEAHGGIGTLPLLSHALLETWRRRQGNTLTLAAFHRAGGIDGALAATAEAVYATMTPRQQQLTRSLLPRLVVLGDATEDTERRTRRSELDDDEDTTAVLSILAEARLPVLPADSVEITHEALLDAWPRLRDWLDEDHDGQRLLRGLTESAAIWADHGEDPDTLLGGTRLEVAREWARDRHDLSSAESRYLAAGIAADKRDRQSKRRRRRSLRALLALVSILAVTAAGTAFHADTVRKASARERDIAAALGVADEITASIVDDPPLAAARGLDAYRLSPSPTTGDLLLAAAGTASGARLADGECGCMITMAPRRDLVATTHRRTGLTTLSLLSGQGTTDTASFTGGVGSGVFSPDGRTLVTHDAEARAHLWDVTDPSRPVRRATLDGRFGNSVFAADSTTLFTQGSGCRPSREPSSSGMRRRNRTGRPEAPGGCGTSANHPGHGTWPNCPPGGRS
ncbi:hypothetical protein GCM10022243_54300 [Saccharothrix violaceirubra]